MFFRRAVYRTSLLKRFSDINITKKLAKENVVFKLTVYCVQVKTLAFLFETNKSKLQQTNG